MNDFLRNKKVELTELIFFFFGSGGKGRKVVKDFQIPKLNIWVDASVFYLT